MVQKIENCDVACFDGTVDVIWHYVNKMGYNAREICHTTFPTFDEKVRNWLKVNQSCSHIINDTIKPQLFIFYHFLMDLDLINLFFLTLYIVFFFSYAYL